MSTAHQEMNNINTRCYSLIQVMNPILRDPTHDQNRHQHALSIFYFPFNLSVLPLLYSTIHLQQRQRLVKMIITNGKLAVSPSDRIVKLKVDFKKLNTISSTRKLLILKINPERLKRYLEDLEESSDEETLDDCTSNPPPHFLSIRGILVKQHH